MLENPLARYYLLIAVLLSLPLSSFSQRNKSAILQYDNTARFGKVVLRDGTSLTGRVVFNDNDGVLTVFTNGSSQSFNSRKIVKAEFFDAQIFRNRLLYSLDYDDPQTGRKDAEFFEVLKELDSFIVLVRIERVKTEAQKSLLLPRASPALVDRNARQFKQTQTVFFVTKTGDFEPYLSIVEKEVSGAFWDDNDTNTHIIDAGVFKKYTGSYFKALVQYAKENALSFKRKADIITILEHYELLSGK